MYYCYHCRQWSADELECGCSCQTCLQMGDNCICVKVVVKGRIDGKVIMVN